MLSGMSLETSVQPVVCALAATVRQHHNNHESQKTNLQISVDSICDVNPSTSQPSCNYDRSQDSSTSSSRKLWLQTTDDELVSVTTFVDFSFTAPIL